MGGVSNQYDGEGHRIQKTVGVDVTKYLLDLQPGLSIALSANKNGDVTRFVHTPVGIHAQEDPNGMWTWAAQDGLGSVRLEANNALSVLGMRHLDPFGNPYGAQGTMTLPFVFTGEIRDENGLQDHRARQYSSQLGIFPSLDPFEGMMSRPMSLNRYSWVEGNPVMNTDPAGLFRWDTFTTETGDCLYCIGRELGIIQEPYDNQKIRDFLDAMIALNPADVFIVHASDCPPGVQNCPNPQNPWLKPNRQLVIAATHDRWVAAQQGKYGRYCYNGTCNQDAATPTPTFTPTATFTPSATPTFTPTFTPSPTFTPLPTNTCPPPMPTAMPTNGSYTRYFTIGPRLDISGGAAQLVDVNIEYHCTLAGGGLFDFLPQIKCGWFANANLELHPGAGGNVNVGAFVAYIDFPDDPGATTFVYGLGGSYDLTERVPIINQLADKLGINVGIEGDVNVSLDGQAIIFLGGGGGRGPSVELYGISGYLSLGASVYLGGDLGNIPQRAWDRMEIVGDQLLEAADLLGIYPSTPVE